MNLLYGHRLEDKNQAHAAGGKESLRSTKLERRLSFPPAAWAHNQGQRTRRVLGSHVRGRACLVPGEQWRCRRHWGHASGQPEHARPNAPELLRWTKLACVAAGQRHRSIFALKCCGQSIRATHPAQISCALYHRKASGCR